MFCHLVQAFPPFINHAALPPPYRCLQEVDRRLAALQGPHSLSSTPWCGHVVSAGLQLTAHSKHRPMDLRVVQEQGGQQPVHHQEAGHQQPAAGQGLASDTKASHQQQVTCAGEGVPASAIADSFSTEAATEGAGQSVCADAGSSKSPAWLPLCEARLKLGALIAAEMRQAVKQETGFRYDLVDSWLHEASSRRHQQPGCPLLNSIIPPSR